MTTTPGIQIRPADSSDDDFILSLLRRLSEFGPPPWRDPQGMEQTDRRVVAQKLTDRPSDTAMFVAVDEGGTRLGYVHVEPGKDYYNPLPHGHVADLVVAPEGEGRGVGSALLERAETWAREQGYGWITLTVFEQNERARRVYERAGYGADMLKYVKPLG